MSRTSYLYNHCHIEIRTQNIEKFFLAEKLACDQQLHSIDRYFFGNIKELSLVTHIYQNPIPLLLLNLSLSSIRKKKQEQKKVCCLKVALLLLYLPPLLLLLVEVCQKACTIAQCSANVKIVQKMNVSGFLYALHTPSNIISYFGALIYDRYFANVIKYKFVSSSESQIRQPTNAK